MIEIITSIAWWGWALIVLLLIAVYDIFINRSHTILHNFPVLGHFRYLLESIGPELRQYIVANNREELPFNRSQRAWIYSSSKKENNYQGFGSDQDFYSPGHIFIKPDMMPFEIPKDSPNQIDKTFLPSAKVIGSNRRRPFRPYSVINVSAMSFGSLSAAAIKSLNIGSRDSGAFHNTGEGGVSPHHSHGADICFQFGTGYFGVRSEDGGFSMEKMQELLKSNPCIKLIEVKLSQGAKPGKGGVLPGKKITAEIAEIRGVPQGQDVLSPTRHKVFHDVDSMVDFIELLAEKTGIPVGIKAAIGKLDMWEELALKMKETGKGPDFIAIDGGEGGTGAAPPAFADHVALPFVYAFSKVYKIFQKHELTEHISFIGSGKLGLPANAMSAFAMGVDVINVARESMMAIGCIQAQICHTNRCPSGIATQSKWLQKGINVPLKSDRFNQYVRTLRKEILEITHAAGYEHPSQLTMEDIEVSMGDNNYTTTLKSSYHYDKTPVPFESMKVLIECKHLGGLSEHKD